LCGGRFQAVIKNYYRGAAGAIIVYDISNRYSYNKVSFWLSQVKECAGHIPTVLIGNKKDQEISREVTFEEALKLSNENGLIFMEASAKTAENVEELFIKMVREVMTTAQTQHIPQEFQLPQLPKPIKRSSTCGCLAGR